MIKFEVSSKLLSPTWWVMYIQDFSQREPFHLAVELICLAIILYLIFSPSYEPNVDKPLTIHEEDELIAEWEPEPMVQPGYADTHKKKVQPLVVATATGPVVETIDGQHYLNLISSNFLGIANHSAIKEAAKDVITNYGVGSCGPRGFYGTIDVHLQLEKTFANFMGTEDAILYSDGLACSASVIAAFCKAGDLIVADEYSNYGIQQGIKLSRSSVSYYKHNDVKSLEEQLQKSDKQWSQQKKLKNRRFIILEGISTYSGEVSPLKQVVELAKKYKFRIILDDTNGIGVLGKTGRGSYEHHGLKVTDVDIICATLDTTLASVGGLCVGSKHVVDHQRLSGAGYCFSAAQPPYTAKAATMSLGLIDANPELGSKLQQKTNFFYNLIRDKLTPLGLTMSGSTSSPITHIRLPENVDTYAGVSTKDTAAVQDFLESVVLELRAMNIAVGVSNYMTVESKAPKPSLRVYITVQHDEADLKVAVDSIATAFNNVKKQTEACAITEVTA